MTMEEARIEKVAQISTYIILIGALIGSVVRNLIQAFE